MTQLYNTQQTGLIVHSALLYALPTELCQNDIDDMNCNYNSNYDNTIVTCVTTTLNCVTDTYCEAVINTQPRDCQFMNIGANESQPIYCCLCNTSILSFPLWKCSIITPSLHVSSSKYNYNIQ